MKTLFFLLLVNTVSIYGYNDLFVDLGYSNVETPFGDNVDLLHVGTGVTFAFGEQFFVGLSSEYRALTRIVKLNKNIKLYKNQKEISLSPAIGFRLSHYIFKCSFKSFGYSVLKQEKNGVSAESTRSKGFDVSILRNFIQNWSFGSRYSTATFEKITIDNETDVRNTAKSITASFILSYNF